MSYTPRTRDRYRLVAVSVTAATTVGALTATGWLSGVAASDYADQQNERAAEQAAAAAKAERAQAKYEAQLARSQEPKIVYKKRPVKTRVTTRYVTGSAGTSSTVGAGGTITSSTPLTSSNSQPAGSGGGGGGSAPPPSPPSPPPTTAPSSGS